jgi:hypothetical protein
MNNLFLRQYLIVIKLFGIILELGIRNKYMSYLKLLFLGFAISVGMYFLSKNEDDKPSELEDPIGNQQE